MKKLLVLLSVFCLAVIGKAQVFNPTVKMGVGISATDPGVITNLQFNGDFVINEHLRVGPGAGIGAALFIQEGVTPVEPYDMVLNIPVFANAKWLFCPDRKVSPFVYGQIGHTFCINNFYDWMFDFDEDYDKHYIKDAGMNASFGPGIDIALKRGSLQVTLDWQMQKMKFNYSTPNWTSETLFGLSVGYSWGH